MDLQGLATLASSLLEEARELEQEMERLKEEIARRVPLHVKAKRKRCGKAHCRCARGEGHGPYLYAYVGDEGTREKRRRKGGKGATRKEVYLGRRWTPPEGWARPQEVQELLQAYHRALRRREAILEGLERAERILREVRGCG